jgi:hypothetical protein
MPLFTENLERCAHEIISVIYSELTREHDAAKARAVASG